MGAEQEQVVGGRYRLGDAVPSTGEREVRWALDDWTDHRVLLARVPTPGDPQRVRRDVGRDVRVATGVRSSRAGRVLDVVVDDDAGLWVVSEGRSALRTLRALVDEEPRPAVGRVARWGRDAADGLAALHDAGLVHRAVGPGLVAVHDDGSAGLLAVAATADLAAGDDDGDPETDVRALATLLRACLPDEPGTGDAAALAQRLDAPGPTAAGLRDELATLVVSAPTATRAPSPAVAAAEPTADLDPPNGPADAARAAPGRGDSVGAAGSGDSGPVSEGTTRIERGSWATPPDPSGSAASEPTTRVRPARPPSSEVTGLGADLGPRGGASGGPGSGPPSSRSPGSDPAGSSGSDLLPRSGSAASPGPGSAASPGPGAASGSGYSSGPGYSRSDAASGSGSWGSGPASGPGSSGSGSWGSAVSWGAAASPGSGPASGSGYSPGAVGWSGAGGPRRSGPAVPPGSTDRPEGWSAAPPGPGPTAPPGRSGAPTMTGHPARPGGPPGWAGPPPSSPAAAPPAPPAPHRRGLIIGGAVGAGVVAVVVVLALVLSVPGTPAPAPPAPAPVGALGDQQTADPCSMLPVPALQALGSVRVYADYGLLSSCAAQVDGPRGSQQVLATFYLPGEYVAGTPLRREGDVTVTALAPTATSCTRVLMLPDGQAVELRADVITGTDPCTGAEIAARGAAPLLAARAVGRRPPDPGGALTSINACAVVDPAPLVAIAGLDANRRDGGFGGWGCVVGYNPAFTNAPFTAVAVTRVSPLSGAPVPLGRHYAQTSPAAATASSPASCALYIVQRAYTGSSGFARAEALRVIYTGTRAQSPEETCRLATTIAAGIEPRLPAPS